MKKQAKIVFYLLDHYPVENKKLYQVFEDLFSDDLAYNNKMIRKAKYRFEQKLKTRPIEDIKKEYLDRYGNNESNNKSNNQSNNKSNKINRPPKTALTLTTAEIKKLKKILAKEPGSNNKSNKISGQRKKHTINLDISLIDQLKKEAKKQGISLSEILNRIIARFLNG